MSKDTFRDEAHWVKELVLNREKWGCKTWILAKDASRTVRFDTKRLLRSIEVCAAVTVRINQHVTSKGKWAQILNASAFQERCGYGTALIAVLEMVLRKAGVDVVVVYSALNGKAPRFWWSLGYDGPGNPYLPPEDDVCDADGGRLFLEVAVRSRRVLPRWEKKLGDKELKTKEMKAAYRSLEMYRRERKRLLEKGQVPPEAQACFSDED